MRKSTRSLVAGVASLSFAAFIGCAAIVLPIGGGDSPAAPDRDRLTPVAEAPEAEAPKAEVPEALRARGDADWT